MGRGPDALFAYPNVTSALRRTEIVDAPGGRCHFAGFFQKGERPWILRIRSTIRGLVLSGLILAAVLAGGRAATAAPGPCQLGNKAAAIQHVIYIQLDNTHLRRDRDNISLRPRADQPHLLRLHREQRNDAHERSHDSHLPTPPAASSPPDRRLSGSPWTDRLQQLRADVGDRWILFPSSPATDRLPSREPSRTW